MRILVIVAFSVLAFANCQSSEGEQSTQQETPADIAIKAAAVEEGWDEIMKIHDEIMPISMKLPPIWEQLDTLKNTADETNAAAMKESITTLKKVHKDMYDWMADSGAIKERLENAVDDNLNTIIEEEKLRIAQIKRETNDAYEAVQELLKTEK
ncbi:MAG: hypothetical protein AB8G11_22335 [Saprospiraceae bacterium]